MAVTITYEAIDRPLTDKELNQVDVLHKTVFGPSHSIIDKMTDKPRIIVHLALHQSKPVGYKIGYELDNKTFYSWLGGVDPIYRKRGIAAKLMEKQHTTLKELGYEKVQTKTMNRWRQMLLLNIKMGFDVIRTYTDDKGRHKIVLEKTL
ncbi:GNAT family N-acetyltransferase [Alkalihalobacillus hemicellulosilyticus]|uniref:N-acetyltransferase domain-containing protein n=1 Tax=Halalkalibacter hemicellulosilyticusJCM 9152 TaxID=1236971 RepID=W4QMH7_9BACI|nr:GNAT family N-acetyltransferase [Halalkalibacter hemicellulosilyticus]GAE32534.1 hypothetical protein JCM9152_4071 [Halalkalibacter hemicellulosilyticusJCM 9152]